MGGENGAGSFRLSVQRAEHSKSRIRKLKKKIAASTPMSRKESSDIYVEC